MATKNSKFINETGRPDGLFYAIDEEKGLVQVQLRGVHYNLIAALDKIWSNNFAWFWEEEAVLNTVYSAKSKANLSEGEVFDVEKGKALARKRVMEKYHKQYDDKLKKHVYIVRCLLSNLEHYCEKMGINLDSVDSVEEIKKKRFEGCK